MTRPIFLLLAAFATYPPVAAHARKPRPTPCPAARYIVHAAPLLGSLAGPTPDRILLGATQLAVASGCPPVAVKATASKRGTTLKATWTACTGATGKVTFKAKIDSTCHTMTGTLLAKKSRPRLKRTFTAGLEQCDVAGGDCGAATSTVRYCDFVPGMSVPVTMPPDVVNPPPPTTTTLPPLPPSTVVPLATTQAQTATFTDIHDAVAQSYVYPDFNGVDWTAVGTTYSTLIQQGLTDADFYVAMKRMITQLGDNHSYYMTPQEVADEAAADAAGQNYVGIGVILIPLPGTGTGSVLVTFPGSPAREAGLRPHDLLLTVDGQPVFTPTGTSPLRGVEGTPLALAFQRPGGAPQTIMLTRRRVTGFTPIDACVVPATRLGYVLVPTFLDPMIDDEIGAALAQMTTPGPLDGLVLDDRENPGGSSSVALPTLGFFTSGVQGQMVSRASTLDLGTTANDIGGSQTVPLALLADHDTVSFGEIFTGSLQHSGRAQVVGGRTRGNVELLLSHDFTDTSRLWLATFTFAPNGLAAGAWEGVGIVPDVSVPTRWDLFTEATDPALAQAIGLLRGGAANVGAARVPAAIGPERPVPILPELRSTTAR
jgi:carboxyl-terminal processing protease